MSVLIDGYGRDRVWKLSGVPGKWMTWVCSRHSGIRLLNGRGVESFHLRFALGAEVPLG